MTVFSCKSVLIQVVPFCSNEPRIKGSFKGLALIYGEVSVMIIAYEYVTKVGLDHFCTTSDR